MIFAGLVVAMVSSLDPAEVQQSELLRFRRALCEAWQWPNPDKLLISFGSVDHVVTYEVELAPAGDGPRTVTVRSRESLPVSGWSEGELDVKYERAKTEQTYDTLDLLFPGTSDIAPRGERDCERVGLGKLVPRLRFAKTGRDRSF